MVAVVLAACGSGGGAKTETAPTPVATPVAAPLAPPEPAPSALAKDDAVLEAVLLHEIEQAAPKPDEALCLRVRDAAGKLLDASAPLLDAIAQRYPKAIPASRCSGGGPTPVTVQGGGAGISFDVGPVKWAGNTALAEGGGGSRGGMHMVHEVEYRVEADGAGWKVVSERVVRQM